MQVPTARYRSQHPSHARSQELSWNSCRIAAIAMRPIATDGVAWSVCSSVCLSVDHGWTDRDAVWGWLAWAKESCIKWGRDHPHGKRQFWGVSGPLKSSGSLSVYTAKGIIQSSIKDRQDVQCSLPPKFFDHFLKNSWSSNTICTLQPCDPLCTAFFNGPSCLELVQYVWAWFKIRTSGNNLRTFLQVKMTFLTPIERCQPRKVTRWSSSFPDPATELWRKGRVTLDASRLSTRRSTRPVWASTSPRQKHGWNWTHGYMEQQYKVTAVHTVYAPGPGKSVSGNFGNRASWTVIRFPFSVFTRGSYCPGPNYTQSIVNSSEILKIINILTSIWQSL